MMASRAEPSDAAGEEAARARHPTRPRRPDLARMRDRFADRLASEGHPWPDLSAAVLAERGRAGLDRETFARTLGVTEETLAGVEDGTRGGSPAPDVPDLT